MGFIIFLFQRIHHFLDITAFIRELLFGHDCVIIPGFGGFIGNYTPARIDRNTGIFYPPVKSISFNRNLTHNDGLLAGTISERLKIGYDESGRMVAEFAGEIRRKVERGEKLIFDHIGSLVRNSEGNILFEPDRGANYLLGSYGLDSFQCFPLEGYDARRRLVSRIDKGSVRQVATGKILWRAAVIIPLLAALVAFPLRTDRLTTKLETGALNPLVTAEFENNRRAVDENIAAAELVLSEILPPESTESAPVVIEAAPVPEPVVPPVSEGPYHIITGSFQSEENAVSQGNILRSEGFAPEIFVAANGFYRVSAMRCRDLQTAAAMKDSIARKIPGTWVLKKQGGG